MIAVELYNSYSLLKLQKLINSFLEENKDSIKRVIDIKLTESAPEDEAASNTVMIIYEK